MNFVTRFLFSDESGQDLIEYALVAALIGLGAVASISGVSNVVQSTFSSLSNSLQSAI